MANEIMLRLLSNVPTYSGRQSMNTVHVQGRRQDFFIGRCVFYNKVLISSHYHKHSDGQNIVKWVDLVGCLFNVIGTLKGKLRICTFQAIFSESHVLF